MNEQEERELVEYGDGVVVGINSLLIDLKAAYDKAEGLWQFGYLVERLLKDYGVAADGNTFAQTATRRISAAYSEAPYDNLRVCSICADRYTTSDSGICDSCRQQQWIDEHG